MRSLVLLGLLALPLIADEGAVNERAAVNEQRGFVAEKVYQFDGIDSVNLFNGNLTLTLPLGGTYPVSSSLSYGFKLHYNSKVWDLVEGHAAACDPSLLTPTLAAFPAGTLHLSPSAGLGWSMSLGRLLPQSQNPVEAADAYVSPDGALHRFGARQPISEPGYSAVAYSKDGAFLRLKVTNAGQYELELEDGTIHTFGSDSILLSMRDRFGNTVSVQNAVVNGVWIWVISDSARTQTIRLADAHTILDPDLRFSGLRWIVESVDLAAFSPDGVAQPVGRYTFEYTYPQIARGCAGGFPFAPCTGQPQVPLLERIRWEPDGSTWEFQYNTASGSECQQGTLKRVTLPTGGAIEWTYGTYRLPANACWNPFSGTDWRNSTVGVTAKTLYDAEDNFQGQWVYQPQLGELTTTANVCDPVQPPGEGSPPYPVTHYAYQQVTNTVTDPVGRKTVHYFATWNDDVVSTQYNFERDYGLPFTRKTPATGAPGPRYLSQRQCAEGLAGCVADRTVYLQYDDAAPELAPRLLATYTVFNDDPGSHSIDSASANFDGFGHYRETTVTSTFGPRRKTTIDYNGTSGTPSWAVTKPWILGQFTKSTVTQTVGTSDETAETRVCFDQTTGALLGRRWLKGSSTSSTDIIARYGYDAAGDRTSEEWFGGDVTALSSDDLCSTTGAGTSEYKLTHEYTSGVRKTSQYRGATFKSFNVTVDSRSGLASDVRDTAGATTDYKYDELGRVTDMRPDAEAWTHYQYDTTSRPSKVTVRTFAVNDPVTATPLTERRIYYDALGRPSQARTKMPGGWSVVNTTYDGVGQKTNVSSPELRESGDYEGLDTFTPASETVFTYDRFGRPKTATTPDGKTTTNTYEGIRAVEQTTEIGQASVTRREESDAHGRLVTVIEDTSRSDDKTIYTYDVGDRLTGVSMTAGDNTQTRSFAYDQRGFLVSETHPEKGTSGNGTVSYSQFDSKGHAGRRIEGTTGGPFDVLFTYDFAERLQKVEDLSGGVRRTLKELTYGTENTPANCTPGAAGCDATHGKLVSAVRYNPVATLGTVSVAETYRYEGLGGRPTRVDTVVGSTASFTGASFTLQQSWSPLGLLDTVTYPTTAAVSQPRSVAYTYDQGLLTGVTGYAAISYQANGLIGTVTHGSGSNTVTETWTADPNGMPRPYQIDVKRGTTTLWSSGTYTFDGAGNIKQIGSTAYTYDPLSRLVAWQTTTPAGYNEVRRAVDAFGNYIHTALRGCTVSGGTESCYTTSLIPYLADPATNHYTGYTYDPAGSVTSDGIYSYAYDALSMMQSLTGSGRNERYLYTADDERIAVVDLAQSGKTRWTLRDTSHRLLRTFTRTGSSWSWTEDQIWRGAHLVAGETPTGRKRYHLDHLGSPRLLTNSSGARIGEQTFAPFGQGGTLDGGTLQFTGHERDTPTQPGVQQTLDYMHARYYWAGVGRFLSVDPAWASAEVAAPQSWNRYAYTRNNPVNSIDPDGRQTCAGPKEAVGQDEALWRAARKLLPSLPTTTNPFVLDPRGKPLEALLNVLTIMSFVSPIPGDDALGPTAAGMMRRTANSEGMTTLWRAVKDPELADIQNHKIFRNLGSAEGKYFSTTAEGAASFAKQAVERLGDTPYTLVKTQAPTSLLPPVIVVDRNVPTVVIPNDVLPKLTKPEVLNHMPIPEP